MRLLRSDLLDVWRVAAPAQSPAASAYASEAPSCGATTVIPSSAVSQVEAPADSNGPAGRSMFQVKVPNSYPPADYATKAESFKLWQKGVEMWKAAEGGSSLDGGPLPVEIIGPRIVTRLLGTAATVVQHLAAARVAQVDGASHLRHPVRLSGHQGSQRPGSECGARVIPHFET